MQNSAGAILSPFDSWLVLRGTKTLARAHGRRTTGTGRRIAEYLARHPKVRQVYYPGLPDHPQHALARAPDAGASAACWPSTWARSRRARAVLNGVRLMALAESLGGVETLISHPATMTHASVPPERRAAIGITDGLVRISVGIEDIDDLLEDLEQALAAAGVSVGLECTSTPATRPRRRRATSVRALRLARQQFTAAAVAVEALGLDARRCRQPSQVGLTPLLHREHEELRQLVRVQFVEPALEIAAGGRPWS